MLRRARPALARHLRAGAVVVVSALAAGLLAGCGGSAQEPSEQSTDTAVHTSQLQTFFHALATMQPARLERASQETAPGSIARKYVAFQSALAAARRDDGVTSSGRVRVVPTTRGYDLCGPAPGRRQCSQFTRIELRDGLIAGFDVDGEPIADNLSVGAGEPEALTPRGSVEFLAAYLQPSTGDYWVLFRVRATDAPVRLNLPAARYARVGGKVLSPVTMSEQSSVQPGSAFTAVLVFPEADIGGTVQLHPVVGGKEQPLRLGTAPFVPQDSPS